MAHAETPSASCSSLAKTFKPYFPAPLITRGTLASQTRVTLAPGHEWLIEAREQGNDAMLEVEDSAGHIVVQADHPERRTGTRRAILPQSAPQPLILRFEGKEHESVTGTVEIEIVDLAEFSSHPACVSAYRALAAADADYAIGQQISRGRTATASGTARDAYLRAVQKYLDAEKLFADPADATLRGEAALAVAGMQYFDLQDWRGSAEWALDAKDLFGQRDPYRAARAEAIAAAAWIELANDSVRPPGADHGDPKQQLRKARQALRRLAAFHLQRQERYDAALQINNIGLSYYYEGRFRECIATASSASQLFGQLGETPREALARQNQAMCYWGIGHLPEALFAFSRALKDMKPEPFPQLYLLTLNNAALINYALGHFDDSLRLHGQALELAIRVQNLREQAQSLYGIGVTYYALGDRDQARRFLERSLAIRTAAFDGRGRRATLRSLATIYADRGDYRQAIDYDREALDLAIAPTSVALSRIPLAVHTAHNGNTADALADLSSLIKLGPVADPLITAQARLARAAIERRSGQYDAAAGDLALAMPVFTRVASVSDEFAAHLERARVLQLTGKRSTALAAVDAALKESETIRTQTANPEFRAQLQLPLRAAYELKLDLLWDEFSSALQAGAELKAAHIAAAAFRCADAGRAQSFADLAAQQYSGPVRRELAGDLARRDTLYANLAGLRFALDARVDRHGSEDTRAKALESEIAGIQREVDTVNNAIAARTAIHGSATDTSPLPADSAIIAYWLGAQHAYGWVVTPAGIHWVRLTDPASISTAAREFHDSLQRLTDVSRDRRIDTSSVLSDQIIRPLASWAAPYKRWFFIPDAALSYVVFAALRMDARADSPYVVLKHDVALTPAARMLLARPRRAQLPAAEGRILLVSDPVYDSSDPRLPASHAADSPANANGGADALLTDRTYARIPGTAREASAIMSEFPASSVDAFAGLQATRARLLQLDWTQYRYIHIASHGYLDARMPQLSALILSGYDERGKRVEDALRAADLASLTLRAELAVFSGCETALGKDVLNEGMVGITYAALARGAGSVVSSVWQVPDEMSATLMTEFYRHLVRDALSPATALSESMRTVLKRNPAADPALWAAFQVSVATLGGLGSPRARVAKQ